MNTRENQILDFLSKLTGINFIKNPGVYKPAFFRNVPGRFNPMDESALPVRVINSNPYGLTQSTFTLITANTEYSIQGIATMAAITIKARGGVIKFSINEGQSGLNYMSIADGDTLEISVIPFAELSQPTTFYMQSPTAGCIVEILGLRQT